MSTECGRTEEVRDYAFEEVNAASRPEIEKHIAACEDCGLELDRLRLTTAALRVIPDREIPQRIAFVADTAPAMARGWWAAFWASGARLGFASACVLSAALVIFALRPTPTAPAAQTAGMVPASEVARQVNEAVAKAMVEVREQVRAEDARTLKAAIEGNEEKHAVERQAMTVAMENLTFLQKRLETLSTYAMLGSGDRAGGQ